MDRTVRIFGYENREHRHDRISSFSTHSLVAHTTSFDRSPDCIFRTHVGNLPEESWQVDSDNATLAHFARFARVHRALAPYRAVLMERAYRTGAPPLRAAYLQYPTLLDARVDRPQFFLGDDLLVAPVVGPLDTEVRVWFPPARRTDEGAAYDRCARRASSWTNVWTSETYGTADNSTTVVVGAPIGQPPVFYRTGCVVGELLAATIRRAYNDEEVKGEGI